VGRVLKYRRRIPRDRIYPKPRDDHPGPGIKKRKRSEAEAEANEQHEETNVPDIEKAEEDPYSDDIWTKHYTEYATHRLARLEYFQRYAPGSAPPPDSEAVPAPEPAAALKSHWQYTSSAFPWPSLLFVSLSSYILVFNSQGFHSGFSNIKLFLRLFYFY
jgi:hypothetical protein